MRKNQAFSIFLATVWLLGSALCFAQSSAAGPPTARRLILFVASGLGPHQMDLFEAVAESENIPSAFQRMERRIEVKPEILGAPLPDRFAAGSTLATGQPTPAFQLAVDVEGRPVTTLLEHGMHWGYSCGLITLGELSRSALAAFAVHASEEIRPETIARQLFEMRPQVLVGGDEAMFRSVGNPSLIDLMEDEGYTLVRSREELQQFRGAHLAGFFEHRYAIDAGKFPEEPDLDEIVLHAAAALEKNPRGSLLLVETAPLDLAGRQGDIVGLIHELKRLNRAVGTALDLAQQRSDTLVAVISPYETGNFLLIRDQTPVLFGKYPGILASPAFVDQQIGQSRDIGHVLLTLQQFSGIPFLEQHALADVCNTPAGEERATIIGRIYTHYTSGGAFIQDRPSARTTPGLIHGPNAAAWPDQLTLAEAGRFLLESLDFFRHEPSDSD